MAKAILMYEFHLTVHAPDTLREAEGQAIREALDGESFRTDLRGALRDVIRRYPALRKVRITILS